MFICNLEDVAKKLKIDFDAITKQIEHNVVKGRAREDLLKNIDSIIIFQNGEINIKFK